jgi:drug/metabolite transporter (DMT)-like permease
VGAGHLGAAAALGAALAWAAGAVLFKRPAAQIPPVGLATLKGLLGLAVLAPLWWWLGPTALSPHDALWLAISGVVGIAIGDACFFAALGQLPAHVVVLLSLGGQALVVLLAVLLLGERLTALRWTGIALVLAGLGLALLRSLGQSDGQRDEQGNGQGDGQGARPKLSRQGLLWGLAAVAAMSAAVLMTRRVTGAQSALQVTVLRLAAGTGTTLLPGLFGGRWRTWLQPLVDRQVRREWVAGVLVGTVGGFWLFHLGLQHAGAAVATTLTATEPLWALPLAWWWLGERPDRLAVVGAVVAAVGVVLLLGRG